MLLFLVPKSSIKILKVGMIFGVIAGIIISSILFMAISDYMAVLNNGSAPSNLSSSYNDAMGIGSLLGSASMVFFLIEAVIALQNLPNLAQGQKMPGQLMHSKGTIPPSMTMPSQIEASQTMQFACPKCQNMLRINDLGMTMNVKCPICSTMLTVQSRRAEVQAPKPQQPAFEISCPECNYVFSVMKTKSPMQVQCPKCGVKGTIN